MSRVLLSNIDTAALDVALKHAEDKRADPALIDYARQKLEQRLEVDRLEKELQKRMVDLKEMLRPASL